MQKYYLGSACNNLKITLIRTFAKKRSVKWSEVDKKLFYWIVIRYYIYKDITENR